MKEKYPVSGFTRDKEAIYVNGIRIFVPAEYYYPDICQI
jgi:hypothetical protein